MTYVLDQAKKEIIEQLRTRLPETILISVNELEEPPQRELGDLAYPCFSFSKEMKKAPAVIAAELAEQFEATDLVAAAKSAGPYINFSFNLTGFSRGVLSDVITAQNTYGQIREDQSTEKPKNLLIEYGQPNTHKEVHVGHLRNFFLGLSVVRITQAIGYKVIPISYIGDVGAHVAKCLWAYKKFHDTETPEPGHEGKFLGGIYTEASQLIESDESLKEEVAEVQRALESDEPDPEWLALWQETRQWSLAEMNNIFAELGCEFEHTYYESEVECPGKKLVRQMLADGLAKESQGAIVMDLEDDGLGIFLLLKSDGNSLYATKDLALAKLKFKMYPNIDTSIHIVDTRQSLYFQQLFVALQRLGFDQHLVHLAHDFVTLKEGAMSSRKGNVITYTEFRDQMMKVAQQETQQRHLDWSEDRVNQVAWLIAEGAMKFAMLKQDSDKPITFDPAEALAFEGFTGPYVQYAHARMSSILAKIKGEKISAAEGNFTEDEFAVLRTVAKLPAIIEEAARLFRPSVLAQYAFELAQQASAFYRDVPVLTALESDRGRRLEIVQAIAITLESTLHLLGIRAPKEM
ncbi:arginine--tRNA ligase [Patescibacteria group bacterium]|nr:arginine--tRNA ligase [Patescibacteria group bacterium]